MRNLKFMPFSVLAAALIIAVPALAQNKAINNKNTGESLSKYIDKTSNIVYGEIISVDLKNREAQVKEKVTGNQIKIKVADDSTLGSFSPRDRVRITFNEDDPTTAINIIAADEAQ
jgi:hypothetical protein